MSENKKCFVCVKPIEEEEGIATVMTVSGALRVHRHCLLSAEHQAAATLIEEYRDHHIDTFSPEYEKTVNEIRDQLRRRAQFYNDHNDQVAREREALKEGKTTGEENVVAQAARECGYGGREREWAGEVLLREAQRVVYGPPAVAQDDWEGQAKSWHHRCCNLREYIAGTFHSAFEVKHPNLEPGEIAHKVMTIVEKIEKYGREAPTNEKKIQVVQALPRAERRKAAKLLGKNGKPS